MKLQGTSGREYIYAVEAAERHGPPGRIGPLGVALRWSVSLLVSGLICYVLTGYLTAPILRLREASQHLAQGDHGGIIRARNAQLHGLEVEIQLPQGG